MSPRAGRHLTTGATLAVLVLVLVGMAVWGWQHVTAPFASGQPSAQQSCTPAEITTVHFLRPADVQVSVYNAGHNSGLAGRTMNRLQARGFQPGEVGNAPGRMHLKRALVRTTKKHDPAAELVAGQLGKHVRVVVVRKPGGPGVDVFLGNRFHKLQRHAPTKVRLPKPIRQCVPVQ